MSKPTFRRLAVHLLRPVVRFFVRHALRIQDLQELGKELFIEAAREELVRAGERVTASRLSIISGMHRRDVLSFSQPVPLDLEAQDLVAKVVGQWQTDGRYLTKHKTPRVLSVGGVQSEFSALVRAVSSDLNPATVLFECERVGMVERSAQGVRLVNTSYTPKGDSAANFALLETDLDALVRALEENVLSEQKISNLHAHTIYDRVRPEAVDDIRRWLLREGHALHARAREYISGFDQDVNPPAGEASPGVRVILGTFGKVDCKDNKTDRA